MAARPASGRFSFYGSPQAAVNAARAVSITRGLRRPPARNGFTLTWDAEGRLTQGSGSAGTFNYTYNGLGQLVNEAMSNGSNDEYLYNAAGNVIGVYNNQFCNCLGLQTTTFPNAAAPSPYAEYNADSYGDLQPMPRDALGSTTDQALGYVYYNPWGMIVQCCPTYERYPSFECFNAVQCEGFNWTASPGGGYNAAQGRWMNPANTLPDLTNPQSLNEYSYAANDPTSPIGTKCPSGCKCKKKGLTPCSQLNLDDPNTFWNPDFVTPDQLEKFFQSQTKAPSSWDGVEAAKAFAAQGINPGLAAGIMGAETSFGNGKTPLSPRNINDPFSSGGANFGSSLSHGVDTVVKLEEHTYTPGKPISALENRWNDLGPTPKMPADSDGANGQLYSGTNRSRYPGNINSWFQKLAKFLGKCR